MEVYKNLELEDLTIGGEIEIWKQVNSIDGLGEFEDWYWVSSFGRVKSTRGNEKILRQSDNGSGYLRVYLRTLDGKRKMMYTHRLVGLVFVEGHSKERNQSNHINEVKTDNRAVNLNWMSAKQNANFGTRNERVAEKLANGITSKPVIGTCVTTGKVIEFPSIAEAQRNGFHSSNISYCCNGKSKTHKGYKWKFKESA